MSDENQPGPLTPPAAVAFPPPTPGFPLALAISSMLAAAYATVSTVSKVMAGVQDTIGGVASDLAKVNALEGTVRANFASLNFQPMIDNMLAWDAAPSYSAKVAPGYPNPHPFVEANPSLGWIAWSDSWWSAERINVYNTAAFYVATLQ